MPVDQQTTALEALARAIDASGFDQSAAVEPWAARRRQSSYDKARKYLAVLDAAGWALIPARKGPPGPFEIDLDRAAERIARRSK